MNKTELKLWEEYTKWVDEKNSKSAEAFLSQELDASNRIRLLNRKREAQYKKKLAEYRLLCEKDLEEWNALPFYKRYTTKPQYRRKPQSVIPFIAPSCFFISPHTKTYEGFMDWKLERLKKDGSGK